MQQLQEAPTTNSATQPHARDTRSMSLPSFILFNVREIIELRFALGSFVYNTLRRRYRRSFLGFAWSLLNPLLMMCVMTAVFSLLFHMDPKQYGVYIFTGSLPWTFIVDSLNSGCDSIIAAEVFHKKMYLPKLFFPLVSVSVESVNFLLSITSLLLLFVGLGLKLSPALLLLPAAVLVLSLFNFGLGLACAVWTVYFRDLAHIIKVVLGVVFYLTPIIYPLNLIPEQYAAFFKLNPAYYFVNLFRVIILEGKVPSSTDWLIPSVIALTTLWLGLSVLKSKDNDLIYRL